MAEFKRRVTPSRKLSGLMGSFCEVTMGAAEMVFDPHATVQGSDARVRINDARISEYAFLVRRIATSRIDDDDVILLATVLARAVDTHVQVTRSFIETELRAAGRSPHKATQLASAIIR